MMPMATAGTKSYQDFSAGLQDRMQAERVAASATIEISRRCPLKCVHCYNNLPMNDSEARSRELDYAEHCRLLDELADEGCLWLLYTGGEIFARRDFLDIYTYAKKKGFIITLFTNGTLVTERIADHLVAWRPFAIEITLYGLTGLLRAPHRHSRLVREVHARHPPPPRARSSARAQDRRGLDQPARNRR